jgi:hypothetical protein
LLADNDLSDFLADAGQLGSSELEGCLRLHLTIL